MLQASHPSTSWEEAVPGPVGRGARHSPGAGGGGCCPWGLIPARPGGREAEPRAHGAGGAGEVARAGADQRGERVRHVRG